MTLARGLINRSVLTMKIAVTAEGRGRNAKVDPHFARARCFRVLSLGGRGFVICNSIDARQTPHLAGTQAAGTLIGLGVQAVIVGQIGPKAFATFQAAGVRVFQAKEKTVAEAITSLQAGELPELTGANAAEHWPQT